jgi:hypothetical protein
MLIRARSRPFAEIDADRVFAHLDMAGDDLDKLRCSFGKAPAHASPLMRQDDLEALFGDRRAMAVRREKQINRPSRPTKQRAKRVAALGFDKRIALLAEPRDRVEIGAAAKCHCRKRRGPVLEARSTVRIRG